MGGKPRCQICHGEAAVTIHERDQEHPGQWHWVHYCALHDPDAPAEPEATGAGRPDGRAGS
jgi:hypothetical protein